MRRILATVAVVAVAFSLAGCGGGDKGDPHRHNGTVLEVQDAGDPVVFTLSRRPQNALTARSSPLPRRTSRAPRRRTLARGDNVKVWAQVCTSVASPRSARRRRLRLSASSSPEARSPGLSIGTSRRNCVTWSGLSSAMDATPSSFIVRTISASQDGDGAVNALAPTRHEPVEVCAAYQREVSAHRDRGHDVGSRHDPRVENDRRSWRRALLAPWAAGGTGSARGPIGARRGSRARCRRRHDP